MGIFKLDRIKESDFTEIIEQKSQSYFRDFLINNPSQKREIILHSIGRTGRLDNVIIGICGISRITPYLGEGWAYFSKDFYKHPKKVIKAIREFLKSQRSIRRIQCTVDVTNYKAIRFAEVLGFKAESILKAYGPEGHDHIMFTIIQRNLDWEVN